MRLALGGRGGDAGARAAWLGGLAAAAGSLLTLWLWQALGAQAERELRRRLDSEARRIASEIQSRVEARVEALARMARRWEFRGQQSPLEWARDAQLNLEDLPGYQAIAWVDPAGILRWVEPPAGNERARGADLLGDPQRRAALASTRSSGEPALTPPLALYAGGTGFVAAVAVKPAAAFAGWIVGTFRAGELLDAILTDAAGRELAVEVQMSGVRLRPARDAPLDERAPSAEARVAMGGQVWRVRVAADEGGRASPLATLGPATGLALSGLLGATVFLGLRSRERAERLKLEGAERARQEAILRSVLDSMAEGVVVADASGRLMLTNPANDRIVGQGLARITPEAWARHYGVHTADAARLMRIDEMPLARALEGETPDDVEVLIRREGAEDRLLSVSARPIHGTTGPQGAVAVFRDVTLRRQLEEEERRARELFTNLLEAAPEAILVVAADGRVTLVNRRAEQLFGYGRDELLGAPVERLVPESLRSAHAEHRRRYQRQPAARPMGVGLELMAVRRGGQAFPVEISLSPLEGHEGPLVIAAVRDLTERKAFEAELKRSNAELEGFAYAASHDLQEPLRMVVAYTQLLERRYRGRLGAEADEFIAFVVDGARHMQQLIDDLLALSRVGSRPLRRERVDLDALAKSLLPLLERAILEARATVEIGPLPVVHGDDGQLRQLLQNLLTNALKFRDRDAPRIRLSARRAPLEWVVAVEDNGIGVAAEHRERIFDMFQRLHRREEYPGTGIGLALCRKVVERHGGRIWVEAADGHGSRFCFSLPASADPAV
jgi:PAS domain S-box-containing protein